MTKTNKILIAIMSDLIFAVIAVCVYGLIIGGEPGFAFILYSVVISAVLSCLSVVFIKGKNCIKDSSFFTRLLIIAAALVFCMYFLYNAANGLATDNQYKEYETAIEFTSANKTLGTSIGFYNQAGELVSVTDYNFIWTDDDAVPVKGATLTIREYNGAFNYPKYEIEKVNGREEK